MVNDKEKDESFITHEGLIDIDGEDYIVVYEPTKEES